MLTGGPYMRGGVNLGYCPDTHPPTKPYAHSRTSKLFGDKFGLRKNKLFAIMSVTN